MKKEIPTSRKAADDAKRRRKSKTRAEKKAEEKVTGHVERHKPGPGTDRVDHAVDSDPK